MTAELAVGLVGTVLVLAAVLGVGVVAVGQLRVIDAARAGARAAARGEPVPVVQDAARRAAGSAVVVHVRTSGPRVTARVTTTVSVPLPGRPGVPLTAEATVPVERGVAP